MRQSKAALSLKRLRERAGLSVRETAEALGRPASSYASYEDKYKKPFLPIDLVHALIPVLAPRGVKAEELFALAGVTKEVMPPRPRVAAGKDGAAAGQGNLTIDEVDVRASAGGGAENHGEQKVAEWQIPRALVHYATNSAPERVKIITVIGDSMEPTFRTLDKVMVDTSDVIPSPPGVFVVWDGLNLVLKRVQYVPHSDPPRVRITSDNDHYSPYERSLDEAYIRGRVLGKWQWV